MYERLDDSARWVFEHVDICGGLESALIFAKNFRNTLAQFYMDGPESVRDFGSRPSRDYVNIARGFWTSFFEGSQFVPPKEVITSLSEDSAAPFVIFGMLQSKVFEAGYRGGDVYFDKLSNDLASGGCLH